MKIVRLIVMACFSFGGAFFSTASANKAIGRVVQSALPAIPSVGRAYTLGQLFGLINTSNPVQSSNFIMPTLQGKIISDAQCWPSQGPLVTGSVSANSVNFGTQQQPIYINKQWITANAGLQVQLKADPALVAFLTRDNRLIAAGGLSQQYSQILLYFVLNINGKGYRFYLNDPCPGRVNGAVNPALFIIKKWNFQLAFNP